jgi:heat shock protein 4
MEAIETARKRLSADKEAPINVDYLLNEEDLNASLKREEFEECIAACLTRFREVL